MNKEIKLHTIATFQDKEYELEELLNELLKENFKLQQRIDKYEKVINELREYMLDIDYKMGWQYANKLDKLLEGENDDN